jgi:dipeptidyl aminopeptidase/acylaminoacyl peptidase
MLLRMLRNFAALACLCVSVSAAAEQRVLTHEDVWLLQRIGAPVLSPDGKQAVFSVTEPSYDSAQTVADLWIVPTDGSAPARRLTNTRGAESGATFSPDGTLLAFATRRDGDDTDQIYLLPLHGGEARRLTSVASGAAGPKFRSDGKAVLFTTTFAGGASSLDENKKLTDEQKARKDTARIYDAFPMRFWNVWLDTREPVIAWQELDGKTPTVVRVAPLRGPFDGAANEALNPAWTPDGGGIVFQALANRERGMSEAVESALYVVPARGGAPKRITPAGTSFGKPQFSPDGQALYAIESRGATPKQIYFVDRLARFSGSGWSQLSIVTAGWDRSVGNVTPTPDGKSLYVEAEDDGTTKVFRFAASGGAPEVVYAPAAGALTDLQTENGVVIGRATASTDPGQIVRLDPATKSVRALTSFNKDRLAQLSLPKPEHFWFTAKNGKKIHSIVVPPPVVEPGKMYPVLVNPHGGPNSMSADAFSLRWNIHLLTSPGYYLIQTNYTGSTGFGEKFTDDIERDVLRGPALETLEAVGEAAKKYPQMDLSRQAAAGASYGGYLMNWYNGTTTQFKCLVNHAGAVNNESQYGVNDGGIDRELRMGAPIWDTGKGQWFDQSPIRYAKSWKTPTLVTQGELDYRVPLSESMTTFKLLQRLRSRRPREHRRDVSVRPYQPDFGGLGVQCLRQSAVGVDRRKLEQPQRSGAFRADVFDRGEIDAFRGEEQEAVARDLAEALMTRAGDRDRRVRREDARSRARTAPARRSAREGPRDARRRQRRLHVPERLGEPARVHVGPRRGVARRARERVDAAAALLLVARNQEVHRRARDLDVLERGGMPLVVIALEQSVAGPAVQHERQLPGRVLRVRHAGIEPARAERRDQMREVSREQDTPDAHAVDDARVKAIDRLPLDLVRPLADDRADARVEGAARFFRHEVVVGRHLPVAPERRSRAGMDQHLSARIPRGIEVEAALVRPRGQLGADVADQEAVVEGVSIEGDAEHLPHVVTFGSGAGDDIRALDIDSPRGRLAAEHHAALALLDTDDAMIPANVDPRTGGDRLVEDLFSARL